jgi:hypothetical protein
MEKIEAAGGKCFVVYDEVTLNNVENFIDTLAEVMRLDVEDLLARDAENASA